MDHFYQKVPGFFAFERLYFDAVYATKAPALFVEVGSWLGRSAAFMGVEIVKSGKAIEFCCIDPWTDGGPDLKDTPFFLHLPEDARTDLFRTFLHNTRSLANVIKPMRMTSLEAVQHFQDESIDFLMLDGDHNYPVTRQEIEAYLPKMKKGGLIAGDDYRWPGVYQAVGETIGHNHVGVRDVKKDRNYKLSASYWFYRVK